MSNIYKPIYRWKALDERNPMVYDILGIDKIFWDFVFTEAKNRPKNHQNGHNFS